MMTGLEPVKSASLGRRKPGLNHARLLVAALLASAGCVVLAAGPPAEKGGDSSGSTAGPARLEQTRLLMGKWIETQRIIATERKDWQQGKEILVARVELIKKEIASLEEKIKQAEAGVAEANKKRAALVAENDQLKAVDKQLTEGITRLEGEARRMQKMLPEPGQAKLDPLYKRIPEDPAKTRASAAERFQNILGILNEVNKSNNEITVNYEVQKRADGSPAEVKAIYVGLGQAYYVSASGDAGVGRPTAEGWKWEPANEIAGGVTTALEILQGKQTAAFVPLPVKLNDNKH